MNYLSALLCIQAYHIPSEYYYGSSESSEEEYRVLVTANNQPPLNLAGVGVYNQPILQAVKVKVPRYLSPEIKQQIINQTLAARGLSLQDFSAVQPLQGGLCNTAPSAGVLLRQQQQLPALGAKGVSVETLTVANNVATAAGLSVPVLPEVPKVPVVPGVL